MNQGSHQEYAPAGFDSEGWPLPEVRSMMIDNFTRSWTRHWMAVMVIFAVSVFLIMFSAWLVEDRWEARADLRVEPAGRPKDLNQIDLTEPLELSASVLVKNLIEMSKSRNLLLEVIDELRLDEYFEDKSQQRDPKTRIKKAIAYFGTLRFLRKKGQINWRTKALEELESTWMSIAPLEGTTIVPLIVYGDEAGKAKEVADAILNKLQQRLDDVLRTEVEREVAILRGDPATGVLGRIAETEAVVRALEDEITQTRKQLGYFSPAQYADAVLQGVAQLQQNRETLALEIAGADAIVAQHEIELNLYEPFVELRRTGETLSPTERTSNQLETQLARLRSELEVLKIRYPASSIEVRGKEAAIASTQQSLDQALADEQRSETTVHQTAVTFDQRHQTVFQRWIEGRSRVLVLEARRAGIDSAIAALQQAQQTAIDADIKISRLRRDVNYHQQQHSTFRSKLDGYERLLQQPRLRNDLWIEPATVKNENKADYPNLLLAMILAVGIGLFAALVLPVSYDYLNQTLLSSRQASSIPGLRLVAIVPRMSSGSMFKSVGA